MQGKRGLIMGIANDHSIAWGMAKTLHAHGAELAFTFQGEALGKRVKPLAEQLGVELVLPCDVEDIASVDATFDALAREMGQARFRHPRDRLCRQERAEGPLRRHQPRELFAHHGDLLLLVHGGRKTRRRADDGGRQHDHADLRRLGASDAELQRDGRGQGGAGSLGALPRLRFRAARHPRQRDLRRPHPHARRLRHRRGACDVCLHAKAFAAPPRRHARRARRLGAVSVVGSLRRRDRRDPLCRFRLQHRPDAEAGRFESD